MPKTYAFHHVDVFTETPLEGNPLAVFPDARGLDASTMQRIARETNLSETTFVFPPSGQGIARVRIFTPYAELPFAGHPTIGTAYVLRKIGAIGRARVSFAFEEGVGLVAVRIDEGPPLVAWLTTPPIALGPTFEARDAIARALGLEPSDLLDAPIAVGRAGEPFLFVPLQTVTAVDRAALDPRAIRVVCGDVGVGGVFAFALREGGVYCRMFAPEHGIVEDPATGSAAGPLAEYLLAYRLLPESAASFVCEQGVAMGRRSLLHVLVHANARRRTIEVGGSVAPIVEGTLTLP
jgi:trans-2,3-dihydro-3-hydroxyanthranilate isomerase